MNNDEIERAYTLRETLARYGVNHGLLLVQGNLVIRDGVNRQDVPAMLDEADLRNAIELGLLQENHVSGSDQWIWHVPTKRVYTTKAWLRDAPDRKYSILTVAESKGQANIGAREAIRLSTLPEMDGSEMDFETSDRSGPKKTGDDYNFIIYTPNASEVARG